MKRSESSNIGPVAMEAHLNSKGASKARWIVVYSAGQESPDERERLIALLGRDPFPEGSWINLLYIDNNARQSSTLSESTDMFGTEKVK